MRLTIIALLTMLMLRPLFAAERGWVYAGDLDGDGIADSIRSGPEEIFGRGGGPFLLTITGAEGEPDRHAMLWASGAFVFALDPGTEHWSPRLWSYTRVEPRHGAVGYIDLDQEMAEGGLMVRAGDDGREIDAAICDAIFDQAHQITLQEVQDYRPPELPPGIKW